MPNIKVSTDVDNMLQAGNSGEIRASINAADANAVDSLSTRVGSLETGQNLLNDDSQVYASGISDLYNIKATKASPNIEDSLTVTATVNPDQDAKIELIDKSSGLTQRGGLYKKDGSLYVGTFTDYTKNVRFREQADAQVLDFPENSGLRFAVGGDLLKTYAHDTFTPTLNVGGVTQSSYNNETAYYTKIGRNVIFHIEITIQQPDAAIKALYDSNSNAQIKVNGLPFEAQASSNLMIKPVQGFINCSGTSFPLYGNIGNSSKAIYFQRGLNQPNAVAGKGLNYRRLKLGDFDINPFNFNQDQDLNKFRFSISGVYMSNED